MRPRPTVQQHIGMHSDEGSTAVGQTRMTTEGLSRLAVTVANSMPIDHVPERSAKRMEVLFKVKTLDS